MDGESALRRVATPSQVECGVVIIVQRQETPLSDGRGSRSFLSLHFPSSAVSVRSGKEVDYFNKGFFLSNGCVSQ
jgi:hypothetical protein